MNVDFCTKVLGRVFLIDSVFYSDFERINTVLHDLRLFLGYVVFITHTVYKVKVYYVRRITIKERIPTKDLRRWFHSSVTISLLYS